MEKGDRRPKVFSKFLNAVLFISERLVTDKAELQPLYEVPTDPHHCNQSERGNKKVNILCSFSRRSATSSPVIWSGVGVVPVYVCSVCGGSAGALGTN